MSSNSVFISYRRDASKYLARAVFQDLKFNRGIDVFMDVESIDSGTFDTIILNQIAARPYFLLILTPATLTRCVEPGDWLLREINHAMSLNRIIIPMTTPEFSFDDADKFLESSLAKELRRFSGLGIIHEYFDAGMDKLCNRFLKEVDLQVNQVPKVDKDIVENKLRQLEIMPRISKEQLSAQAWFEQGRKAFSEKQYDTAIKCYDNALRLNPDDATAYNNRGLAFRKKGEPKQAIDDYTEAIRLNPQYDRAYNNRGVAYAALNDNDKAIADYNRAVELAPYYSTAFNNRAEAYFRVGLFKLALTDFEQAIKLRPNYKYAVAGFAITQFATGEIYEAQNVWKSLIATNSRYRDHNWVGKELNWHPLLIDEARKLIASL